MAGINVCVVIIFHVDSIYEYLSLSLSLAFSIWFQRCACQLYDLNNFSVFAIKSVVLYSLCNNRNELQMQLHWKISERVKIN